MGVVEEEQACNNEHIGTHDLMGKERGHAGEGVVMVSGQVSLVASSSTPPGVGRITMKQLVMMARAIAKNWREKPQCLLQQGSRDHSMCVAIRFTRAVQMC